MHRMISAGLALVVLTWAAPGQAQTHAVGVRDGARLFSADAVRKASAVLKDVERDHGWQVVIETVDDLGGQPIRDKAIANAKALQVHGLYVLISKGDHKVWAEPSRSAEAAFPRDKVKAVSDTITAAFKAGQFDKGLADAVALVQKDADIPVVLQALKIVQSIIFKETCTEVVGRDESMLEGVPFQSRM